MTRDAVAFRGQRVSPYYRDRQELSDLWYFRIRNSIDTAMDPVVLNENLHFLLQLN